MRPILSILITTGLLLGVNGYIQFAKRVRRPAIEIQVDYAQGDFFLELERTFECVSDPILDNPALEVRFKGKTIYSREQPLPVDEPLRIGPITGIETGANEFYIRASGPATSGGLLAIKAAVFQDDFLVTQQMLHNDPGPPAVSGEVVFDVADDFQTDH